MPRLLTVTFFFLTFAETTMADVHNWSEPALLSNTTCWQHESDPATGRIYQSKQQYINDLDALLAAEPPRPGIIQLFRGYSVSRRVHDYALSLGSDKTAHCYVGCMIAGEVNLATARYAGWYKEYEDLTDCNRWTRFEWADIEATEHGAELAKDLAPTENLNFHCSSTCQRHY